MKKLIVATDFSKNSLHALEYAIMFANKMNADIHLVWVDNTSLEDNMINTIEENLRVEKKNFLEELAKKYSSHLKGGKISYQLRQGKVYQEIAKEANRVKADLIFTGTHGITGYEQYWVGSNTYRIVTSAPCPVITIRYDYQFKDGIKKILLPLDSSLETKQKLPFTAELAKLFGAKIFLLKIYNTPISVIRKRIDGFGKDAEKCLSEKDIDFVIDSVETKNVSEAIIDYAGKNDIDLITVMTEQNITASKKFLGPYSQQLLNNSPFPIMFLRDKIYE